MMGLKITNCRLRFNPDVVVFFNLSLTRGVGKGDRKVHDECSAGEIFFKQLLVIDNEPANQSNIASSDEASRID